MAICNHLALPGVSGLADLAAARNAEQKNDSIDGASGKQSQPTQLLSAQHQREEQIPPSRGPVSTSHATLGAENPIPAVSTPAEAENEPVEPDGTQPSEQHQRDAATAADACTFRNSEQRQMQELAVDEPFMSQPDNQHETERAADGDPDVSQPTQIPPDSVVTAMDADILQPSDHQPAGTATDAAAECGPSISRSQSAEDQVRLAPTPDG